jgi:dehydrogenase/reductase SDR family protein 12
LRDRIEDIRARGAELVIVGNGAANFASAFREDFDLDCPLLIDPELRAYRAAGLRRGRAELLSPRLPGNALRALASGSRQTGVEGDPWQLGGVFVVRENGEATYAYTSSEAGDHPPVEEILAALQDDARPIENAQEPPRAQMWLGRVLSRAVDPFVVSSFDRTGFRIHRLAFQPDDLDVDLSGKRCLVTGANSGIGFESAKALADLGAEVVLLCRNKEGGETAVSAIRGETGNARVSLEIVDISDLESIRAFASRLSADPIDVLIHNAGVLPDQRIETRDGLESTFATHVVGPFLLTRLLRSRLERSEGGRVIWVSSGGMYTRRLQLEDPNWTRRAYNGVTAYAESKRAQVILSGLFARAFAGTNVTVNAMHPGWANTPAVESSLPRFHRVTQNILRTPAEGADTVVWLAACPRVADRSGKFFFDREERRMHWLPLTREDESERQSLLETCARLTEERP